MPILSYTTYVCKYYMFFIQYKLLTNLSTCELLERDSATLAIHPLCVVHKLIEQGNNTVNMKGKA